MSFDVDALRRALARRARVVRVVVAEAQGSAPREVGAAMLVWEDGQQGTIGGGALEYAAAARARALLARGRGAEITRLPLGPALGQCCGGAVVLLSEVFCRENLEGIEKAEVFARPVADGEAGEMPLRVRRLLAEARESGARPRSALLGGWMVEPVRRPAAPLWIYGAGHVGRALVDVITPLEDFVITWIDTSPERFPETVPEAVTILPAALPQRAVARAPREAHHLILTYSHALDLELCHALLGHGFASAGLIGSASKWARFRRRLAALGHGPEAIGRITCPIGDKRLGKAPQAIAIGVAAQLLTILKTTNKQTDRETDHERDPRHRARAARP